MEFGILRMFSRTSRAIALKRADYKVMCLVMQITPRKYQFSLVKPVSIYTDQTAHNYLCIRELERVKEGRGPRKMKRGYNIKALAVGYASTCQECPGDDLLALLGPSCHPGPPDITMGS